MPNIYADFVPFKTSIRLLKLNLSNMLGLKRQYYIFVITEYIDGSRFYTVAVCLI